MQIKICDSVFYKMQNQNNKYGEMAERSKAAVLKTVEVKASWGSNPYLSAKRKSYETAVRICFVFLFMGLFWYCC